MESVEQIVRESRSRLHPAITNPSWLVLDKRRKLFEGWKNRALGNHLHVLDVGGRVQPYRPLLEGRLASYIAVDLRRTYLTNVIGSAEQLPFASESFDLVICTQVLQYIPEPRRAINEMARVLRPGGYLFLSVPSACPADATEECWRFLPGGLRHLLSPFTHVEILPEGGSIAGLFRTVNYCFSIFCRYPLLRRLYMYTLTPFLNVTAAVLESVLGARNQQFTVNYTVFAQK